MTKNILKYKTLPTIGISTLGCPKNLVDTENIIGILHAAGYPITADHTKADISLVNTCAFVKDSISESKEVLTELGNQGQKLIITGCLSQRYKDKLFDEYKTAQAIVGTGNIKDILKVVKEVTRNLNTRNRRNSKVAQLDNVPGSILDSSVPRINTQIGPSAYLKIGEGCNHKCAFCIIPYLRGKMRSRSIEDIVTEAKQLVKNGVREIVLVSQDSTAYGIDIYKKRALANLLKAVAEESNAEWIRLMYTHPLELDEEMLDVIAKKENIVKYIDIPLQHVSKKILRSMGRPLHVKDTIELIKKIIPNCAIRTTFITGFPQETEDDFDELYDFIEETEFDRLGIFTYSKEEGTPAFNFNDQLQEEIKQERREKLMLLQQKISYKKNKKLIGSELDMLVEYIEHLGKNKKRVVGRSFRDAPEIDGQLYIDLTNVIPAKAGIQKGKSFISRALVKPEMTIQPGDFIKVTVTGCDEYDLFCKLA